MIKLKRVYEKPSRNDGFRVLVERLWPRAVTKERAAVALWLTEIAPSTELRKWFGHDPAKWEEFKRRYRTELEAKDDAVNLLLDQANAGTVTLVYAAADVKHNSAVILKAVLDQRMRSRNRR